MLSSKISEKKNKLCGESSEEFSCMVDLSEAEDQADLFTGPNDCYSTTSSVEECDILWLGRPFRPSDNELVSKLNGFINRISGTEFFREKELQYTIMNQLKDLLPEDFRFHPSSYSLMREYDLLKKDVINSGDEKLWIAKPSDGGDGDDIFVFRNMEELHNRGIQDDMVVQHYISNPLTLHNRKWDARLYLMIHGINPMKGYASVDWGFGRFCVADYDDSDVTNPFSHITNSAINSKSENFVNPEEEDSNEERVLGRYHMTRVWEMIAEQYPEANIEDMKAQVLQISNGILRAFRPSIEIESSQMLGTIKDPSENSKYFHILGLDIMFDDKFNAWLIETNRFPSMNLYFMSPNAEGVLSKTRSAIDESRKRTIIREWVKILVGKTESTEFVKCYDSEDPSTGDGEFVLEKVYELYKQLSGGELKSSLSRNEIERLWDLLSKDANSQANKEAIERINFHENSELKISDLLEFLKSTHNGINDIIQTAVSLV